MSNARIAEAVTLQGENIVTTITIHCLTPSEEAECEGLLEQIRELARKQAHVRLASVRMRRNAAECEADALLREEIRLMELLDALASPAANYRQSIFDSFPARAG